MTRRFTSEIINDIGPERDIPVPDVGTDGRVMAWIFDTYSMNKGHSVLGVVTGKPLSIGGSLGREEATARGASTAFRPCPRSRADASASTRLQSRGSETWARTSHERCTRKVRGRRRLRFAGRRLQRGGIGHPEGARAQAGARHSPGSPMRMQRRTRSSSSFPATSSRLRARAGRHRGECRSRGRRPDLRRRKRPGDAGRRCDSRGAGLLVLPDVWPRGRGRRLVLRMGAGSAGVLLA